MFSIFQLTKVVERKLAPFLRYYKTMRQGLFPGSKERKVILKPYLVVKQGRISLVFA